MIFLYKDLTECCSLSGLVEKLFFERNNLIIEPVASHV
jgi:hypothetical protein